MDSKLVKVAEFTGRYERSLDRHRLSIPEFVGTIIQRNYAKLPFLVNEGYLEVTPNGIARGNDVFYSFDPPITEQEAGILKEHPLKLLNFKDDLDTVVLATIDGGKLDCRAWVDYLHSRLRGEVRPEDTYPMEPDSLGRVNIPKEVKERLGLEGAVSVVLTGKTDHFTLERIKLKIESYTF